MSKKYFVTGGAGFIGSNLVDRLLKAGHEVVVYDNLSTGRERFLKEAESSKRFQLIKGDLLDLNHVTEALPECDAVFHLAANADIRFGLEHPRKDLEQNTLATFNVLEAMRTKGVKRIVFSSTGPVYGEPDIFPTPENAPFPVQTSLYGASKLACEALIQAYSEGYGFQGYIFRFVSILGERYSHGHVFDFYKQLFQNSKELKILGDGHQRKSYLYIQDCIDALFLALERASGKINIFNLGQDHFCEVNDSVKWITERLKISPKLVYSGGSRGWIGDSPFVFLDTSRMRALGWKPKVPIQEGIVRTVQYLEANPWLLERE